MTAAVTAGARRRTTTLRSRRDNGFVTAAVTAVSPVTAVSREADEA